MTSTATPPAHPKSFGEELRRLREGSGLSIEDIAGETKVSNRVLESLESGRFQYLPEHVFSRNFVRQYARTIGYDEQRLVKAFDEAWEQFQLTSGTHPALLVEEAPPQRPIRWRFWIPIAVGALILLTVAWVILMGSEPGENLMPASGSWPSNGISVAASATSTPDEDGGMPAEWPADDGGGSNGNVVTMLVRVNIGKECWIHYRDREGVTDGRLLNGGDELQLQLRGPVKFTVGNAGAVSIVVGETEYSDLGAPGQVIHTEVSPTGLVRLGVGGRDG